MSSLADYLPAEMSLDDVSRILDDPKNLNYPRLIARLLEQTSAIEEIKQYVDLERLVKEFPTIRNHMKHGKLEGSNREFWEREIAKLAEELGLDDHRIPTSKAEGADNGSREPSENRTVEQPTEEPADADQKLEVRREKQRRKLGQQLSELRQKRGVSRNQLAQNTVLDLQDIAEIEKGRVRLTYGILNSYARGLDMDLQLDFREGQSDGEGDLLARVHQIFDTVFEGTNLSDAAKQHCRITLHQLAEDALYQKRFSTLPDLLDYLETVSKQFSIRDEHPPREIFSNQALFQQLQSMLDLLELTDMAYDEKIRIMTQKALEEYHGVSGDSEDSE